MRDKLVAGSREQPGQCWPCADSGGNISHQLLELTVYYLTRFCQPSCSMSSSHPSLSYYLGAVETPRCYLYQPSQPVSAWRALLYTNINESELMKMLRGHWVMSADCDDLDSVVIPSSGVTMSRDIMWHLWHSPRHDPVMSVWQQVSIPL